MIRFANQLNLFVLPAFLVLTLLIVFAAISQKKIVALLTHPRHQGLLLKNFSPLKIIIKTILLIAFLSALFLALLRPQWGKKESIVHQEGRDVVVLLDISRSMLAQDIKPNRLSFAKLKIKQLLESFSFQRAALIIFSGEAYIQCPLTADFGAFKMFLDNVDAESISSGTTAADKALLETMKIFNQSKSRKNKIVVLISDGEDYSQNLDNAKKWALDEGVTILALGIGSQEGAPVPIVNEAGAIIGNELDEKGVPILTKLNEPLLNAITKELGGSYIKASYGDEDIARMTNLIGKFEQEKFDETHVSQQEERYPLFLAFGFACLLLEWII